MADSDVKGKAFLVLAAIEVVFLVGCLVCGNMSMKADEDAKEEQVRLARQKEYQQLSQADGGMEQIVS
jgi:hypothetical protein